MENTNVDNQDVATKTNQDFSALINKLKMAIRVKNKAFIFSIYDLIAELDLVLVTDDKLTEYHNLVSEANDILYS